MLFLSPSHLTTFLFLQYKTISNHWPLINKHQIFCNWSTLMFPFQFVCFSLEFLTSKGKIAWEIAVCFLQVHFSVAVSLLVLSLLVQISGFRLRAGDSMKKQQLFRRLWLFQSWLLKPFWDLFDVYDDLHHVLWRRWENKGKRSWESELWSKGEKRKTTEMPLLLKFHPRSNVLPRQVEFHFYQSNPFQTQAPS